MKIFCAYHRPVDIIPKDEIRTPVLLGMHDADIDLKVRDYLPEISKENLLYNEVELEMYISKFVKDEDIIGVTQYSCYPNLTYDQMREILKTKVAICHKDYVGSMMTQYYACHWPEPFNVMIEVLKESGYNEEKLKTIILNPVLFSRHIFITKYDTLMSYLRFALLILERIRQRLNICTVEEARAAVASYYGPNSPVLNYQTRIYGFLLERLFTIWFLLHYNESDAYIPEFINYDKVPLG